MPRKTREEKVILHAKETMEDLEKLYNHDGRAVVEYHYLINEYKKLAKRSNRIIDLSDSVGKDMLKHTEKLKENVDYTVKIAKKKILYNIEEHRKTKETLARHSQTDKEIINSLKRELRDLREYARKLEHDLNKNNDVQHTFHDEQEKNVNQKEINSPEMSRYSYQKLLIQQIDNAKKHTTNLTVLKLVIDDFQNKQSLLKDLGSDKTSILKGLHKFFTVSVGSKNIVYYYSENTFYIILQNRTLEDSKSIIKKINVPRKIKDVNITFSIGVSQLEKDDDFNTINKKCDKACTQASKESIENSVAFI